MQTRVLLTGYGDVYDQHNFLLRVDNVLEAIGEYGALSFWVPSVMGYENPEKLGVTSFDTLDTVRNAEMRKFRSTWTNCPFRFFKIQYIEKIWKKHMNIFLIELFHLWMKGHGILIN